MTNIQIYVLISFGCFFVIGAWAIFIAIGLDKARAEIKKLKQELLDTIPF
jgi:uncharacterized membrane protein